MNDTEVVDLELSGEADHRVHLRYRDGQEDIIRGRHRH